MVTSPTKPKAGPPRPRGRVEAIGWRRGGFGFTVTPNALFRLSESLGLEKLDLLVLLAILSHGKPESTDYCTASYDQLSTDCAGLDRKTVVVHVNRLRKLGLLTSESKRKADKTRTANTYNIQPLAEKLNEALAAVGVEPADALGTDGDGSDGRRAALPKKRKGGWATIEKDADDEPEVERTATDRRARATTGSTKPKPPSPPTAREPSPRAPSPTGSRLRPPELDEADRAQLDRSERLRHPDGRELTVDEHLFRMRELECFTRDEMAGLLMDLRFPGEDITAAMNAGPVERLRRLSGGASTVTTAPTTKTTVSEPDDPVQRDALRAVEWAQRYRKEREEKERKG